MGFFYFDDGRLAAIQREVRDDPPQVLGCGRRARFGIALLADHLAKDTAHLDAASALRLYRQIAFHNRCRRDAGEADWRGLAFCLDPTTYAM